VGLTGDVVSPSLFSAGGNLYTILVPLDASPNPTIQCWMSADGGLTWARQDQAGESILNLFWFDAASCTDGTKIYTVSNDPTDAFVQIAIFDTVTGLWSAAIVLANANITNAGLVPTGSRTAAYFDAPNNQVICSSRSSATTLDYFTFDVGTLTASAWINLLTYIPTLPTMNVGILQGVGFKFFVYGQTDTATFTSYYYQALSDVGVLSPRVLILTVPTVWEDQWASSDGAVFALAFATGSFTIEALQGTQAGPVLTFGAGQTITMVGDVLSRPFTIQVESPNSGVSVFAAGTNLHNVTQYRSVAAGPFSAGTILGSLASDPWAMTSSTAVAPWAMILSSGFPPTTLSFFWTPLAGPSSTQVNVILGLKGMKVYPEL